MSEKIKTIAMSPVKSGQIAEIGHEGDTLSVKFKSGGTYHYHGVSADDFAKFKKSESLGSYLHKHIKPKFKFTKLGEKK